MPLIEPEVTSLERVTKRVMNLLSITSENAPYSTTVEEGAKFTADAITDVVLEGDSIVCNDIMATIGHPYRSKFLSSFDEYEEIENGGLIPPYVGEQDIIMIQQTTSELSVVRGKLALSLDRLESVRALPNLYGTPPLYYPDGGSRLRFIGHRARVFRPTFEIDRLNGGVCQSPEIYERGVLAWAMTGLFMDGSDTEQLFWYERQSQAISLRVRNKEISLPDVEAYRRIAT